MTDEMILVPRYELLAWAEEWQYENDPGDGTDCITPFDTYLLKSPVEAQPVRAPAEALRCTCPSGDGSLRWPCPAHPPETQPVYAGVDLEGGWIRATAPPSAPVGVEWLCRVYADAYHAGHHATVEGNYVDVLPVDRDTYWREKVEEDYPEALAAQPVAVDEAMVERIAALLHEEATDEPWAVAGVEHDGPDRDYYRTLARKVIVRAGKQPAAIDVLNAWRAAFIAERATRYREGGMAIEQARIHAETDAALMEPTASHQRGA